MSRASSPALSSPSVQDDAAIEPKPEDDDIDIEQLITLMHRRPALWDKFDPKYHDRILKSRLWEEIYKAIYFTWEQYSVVERKQKGADVQKKWKNLKDTYFKEVAADKKLVSGQARKKKKRPYIHMGALSFLSTQKSIRDTTNNIRETESTKNNVRDLTSQSDEATDSEVSENKKLKASMRKKTKTKSLNNSDDELLKLLQEKKYDEDVSFCEMIIPMLKNLSTEQKHYAKIEILNALNRATKFSPQNTMRPRVSPQSSSSCSSYIPNTPSPYPNTSSPYPNTPSPCLNYQNTQSFAQSSLDPSAQTQYMPMPSHVTTIISQSQSDLSGKTQYTSSQNPTNITQYPPIPSPQTQYTQSISSDYPNTSFNHSSCVQYPPSRNASIIPQTPPDLSSQTDYTSTRNTANNIPITSNQSSYVIEGSGFDMKNRAVKYRCADRA